MITNPGSGYSSGQTVGLTFTGGGGTGVSTASFSPTASSLNVGGGLTKVGSGTLTLTAANTYSGGTTVAAGTLAISGSGTLGATTGGLTMSGGTLDLGGTTNQTVGAVIITAAPSSGNTIQNGSLTGSSYAASNPSGNAIVTANLLDFGSGSSLTMSGAGTLTLTGNNTYSLGTTIQSGTLRAANSSGSATGGGAVQVGGASSSGSPTLAGGGTVGGNVIVSGSGVGLTAGHIAPSGFTGSTGTTLSLGGTLTLATGSGAGTGSVLDFNLANATTVGGGVNDLINITTNSAVNYGTDGVLNINAYDGSLSLGTYTLISDTAALAPTGGTGWTVGMNNDSQSASHTYTISVIGQNLDLVVSAPSYYWTGGTTSWDTTGGTVSWVTSAAHPPLSRIRPLWPSPSETPIPTARAVRPSATVAAMCRSSCNRPASLPRPSPSTTRHSATPSRINYRPTRSASAARPGSRSAGLAMSRCRASIVSPARWLSMRDN